MPDYRNNLGTFVVVEVTQQGQVTLQEVKTSSTIDIEEIDAVIPFWNTIEGKFDTDRTVAYLKSGLVINVATPYTEMSTLITPSNNSQAPS